MDKEADKKTPTFYEIAAKIVSFCDEMDGRLAAQGAKGGEKNEYDKRGLEI